MSSEPQEPAADLAEVEAAVQRALRSGDASHLRLLGHGEISMVLGWPADQPVAALKRVPPFATRAGAESYAGAGARFAHEMATAGVTLVPTRVEILERADGRFVVYHRQPVLDDAMIGHQVLRAAPTADAHPLLDAIVAAVVRITRPGVGIDCQAANWLWDGTTVAQLDVTSPFFLTPDGLDLAYDTSCFLQEYPWPIRRYLKRELIAVVRRFTTPEGSLTDFTANLIKEGLDRWVEPAVAAANRAGVVVDVAEAGRVFAEDRKLFPLTLRLKRAQRIWLRATGRTYESILPRRTTYGR